MAPFLHTPEEEALLNRVRDARDDAEKRIHRVFREKAEHLYRLYRSYQDTKSAWVQGTGRDRDAVLYDAKKHWGAELFIPYAFSIVEVIVPRAVSQRPKMLALPRNPESEERVETVQMLLDAQQARIRYELTLQDVLRTGMIFNLGVQKVRWRRDYAMQRLPQRATIPQRLTGAGAYVQGKLTEICTFDDPTAEWVDPFDWFWDPFAHDIDTCRYTIHRTWRDTAYVMERLTPRGDRPADWDSAAAQALTLDDVKALGPATDASYGQVWNERMRAAGHEGFNTQGEQLHEVWEFHDGNIVGTILDGQVMVKERENPTLGKQPFQIYRPTRVPGEMIGIGEIEPIEHLQLELNALRSQRRDNATLKLMQTYAYDRGVLDEDEITFGPGELIGVNGDPRAALYPLGVGDIPNSSYQEEAAIVNDIQRATGVDDTVAGSDAGSSATATGVQLVQAAANMRIQNKARRLEVETIGPAAEVFFALDQRMILEQKTVRVPNQDWPSEPDAKRWSWFEIAPEDLRGEYDWVPEGGSTQPENMPQERQDAQLMWNMLGGNPNVDQTLLLHEVLRKLGVKHPETWVSQGQALSPAVLAKLAAAGVPQQLIQMAVAQAQAEDPSAGQQAPGQQPPAGADPNQQAAA